MATAPNPLKTRTQPTAYASKMAIAKPRSFIGASYHGPERSCSPLLSVLRAAMLAPATSRALV